MNDSLMRKLQLHDQYICQILHASPDTSLYKFDAGNNKWEKLNVDGTFFLCKRTMVPFYCFLISSSTTHDRIMKEKLTKDMMIQIQIPFLLYKRSGEVKGILFKEEGECLRVANYINSLLSEMNGTSPREVDTNPVKSVTPSSETPSASASQPAHTSNPIPQAQVSATASGQNSIIRMLHTAAAKHSPGSTGPKTDSTRQRPQSIATPQQHLQQSLSHSQHGSNSSSNNMMSVGAQSKNPAHWSNKTHTISVDYLFKSLRNSGQRSPSRSSSPKQTPLTPTQPVVPVPGPTRGSANCLTLSEVEQQALVEASECLRQQLGISGSDNGIVGSTSARGDCQSNSKKTPVDVSRSNSSFASAVVAVDEDGDDDEGLVLTPSMMEQTEISSVLSCQGTETHSQSSKKFGNNANGLPSEIEAVALNMNQIRQALITLIKEDDSFVEQIHHAYIQNLQRHLK